MTPPAEARSESPSVPHGDGGEGGERPVGRSLLGCGCAGAVVVLLLSLVGLTYMAWSQTEVLRTGGDEPGRAAARVRSVLPHEQLPEGYHPLGAVKVPVLLRMAVLTDLPAGERGEELPRFHRTGFIYLSTFSLGGGDEELVSYFRQGPPPGQEEPEAPVGEGSMADDLQVDFITREVVGRGEVEVVDGEVLYVARRGQLEVSGDSFKGLATLLYVRCDERDRVRFGLWFGPEAGAAQVPEEVPEVVEDELQALPMAEMPPEGDPGGADPEDTAAEGELPPSLAGTPADPQALERFLGHFLLCG